MDSPPEPFTQAEREYFEKDSFEPDAPPTSPQNLQSQSQSQSSDSFQEDFDLESSDDSDVFPEKPLEGEIMDEDVGDLEGQVEPPENENIDPGDSRVEEFSSEIWGVLEQAGITKKRLLIFLIVVAVLVFGLIAFLKGFPQSLFSERTPKEKAPTKPVEEVVIDESKEKPFIEGDISSIVSGYIFGLEYTASDLADADIIPVGMLADLSSFETSLLFGATKAYRTERIVYYSDILRKLQNIYSTDLYGMLDNSLDRRKTLINHLAEMKALLDGTRSLVDEIDMAMNDYSKKFEEVAVQRDFHEKSFFINLESLKGVDARDDMDNFNYFARVSNEIKTEYTALTEVRQMFVLSYNAIEPRYRDIEANFEALVKGVRVFDIPDSDIKAIIRLDK